MTAFRLLLIVFLVIIVGYTAPVIANHGANLFSDFFGDILAFGWPGQFNVDFATFLALSALWVAWRHQFSVTGLILAIPAFFGGMLFLATYLLIVSYSAKGDVRVLLLGPERAAA
ncbi:hypothetical protein [Parasphingopyxis sp.]|uniref:hypothetical protein n=1 Tax=Parasphingopyxis sp. TaxID=1920299 RepID=UPI002620AB84|nr:hypothetical protein [Parasphingopyxis sp.]